MGTSIEINAPACGLRGGALILSALLLGASNGPLLPQLLIANPAIAVNRINVKRPRIAKKFSTVISPSVL
jgi:hypothetical protein